jgi:hypothetical protein
VVDEIPAGVGEVDGVDGVGEVDEVTDNRRELDGTSASRGVDPWEYPDGNFDEPMELPGVLSTGELESEVLIAEFLRANPMQAPSPVQVFTPSFTTTSSSSNGSSSSTSSGSTSSTNTSNSSSTVAESPCEKDHPFAIELEAIGIRIPGRIKKTKSGKIKQRTMMQRISKFHLTHEKAVLILRNRTTVVSSAGLPKERQDQTLALWESFARVRKFTQCYFPWSQTSLENYTPSTREQKKEKKKKLRDDDEGLDGFSTPEELQEELKKFACGSIILYPGKFTPYMHIVTVHLVHLFQKYKSLELFSNYKLESCHAVCKNLLRTATSGFKGYRTDKAIIAEQIIRAFYLRKYSRKVVSLL